MEEAFPLYDSSGLRMTPSQPRFLMNCGPLFDGDDCGDRMSCSGCKGTLDKAKCKGRQARCFGSKKGVSFPFLSDPASLLGLLEGKDIGTLDYISTYCFCDSQSLTYFSPHYYILLFLIINRNYGIQTTRSYIHLCL